MNDRLLKLAQIPPALRRGEFFPITRLTVLKGLCEDPKATRAFALFLAKLAHGRMVRPSRGGAPRRRVASPRAALAAEAIEWMERHAPGKRREDEGFDLLRRLESAQNRYLHQRWGPVRAIESMDLFIVETALRSLLLPREQTLLVYQAARRHAEKFDPHRGSGLTRASAPRVEEIVRFWTEYLGRGARAGRRAVRQEDPPRHR